MAGTGHRGRRSVLVLLLFTCSAVSALTLKPDLVEPRCPVGDYVGQRGVCCNKCPAGFKLVEECLREGHRSNCTTCPNGQYLEHINNAINCWKCRTCKKTRNEELVVACKTTQNTICRCKAGYYKKHIDSETYECLRCSECKQDEKEEQKCTYETNTVCECKENYHRVGSKCELCRKVCGSSCQICLRQIKQETTDSSDELHCSSIQCLYHNCTTGCTHHCTDMNTKGPEHNDHLFVNVIAGSAVVVLALLVLVGLITFLATKRFTKKKMLSLPSQPPVVSGELGKHLLISVDNEPEDSCLAAAVPVGELELSKLPDCVPLEIKIPDLIYSVLDLVPVLQVKQLVRSLGVKDTEIEQAEVDHRSCREAHYQMLRVWAERGSQAFGGGKGEMLHRPLLEELLDKLRQMHLGRAAEELETKYPIQ